MKRQRDCSQNMNNIKFMQDEFPKPVHDDMFNLHQVIVEAEKNKVGHARNTFYKLENSNYRHFNSVTGLISL